MENRIDLAIEMGEIPKEIRDQHKGFSEWNSKVTKQDHQSIVKVTLVFSPKIFMIHPFKKSLYLLSLFFFKDYD